ncbi:hypothetical protein Y1Q_0005036 [Alligator mississippiensis]|uniref:Uncharacterized protein n=1 Tax=Alligator mississippiensis TaxID=8496 RepID=A0A151MYS1_ALLMI|nr:hypothetical protein Y1Q_0005036 [Alligator mississippiensis]
MQNGSIITYHPAEAQIDVAFKGQTQSFSEQPDNCSLQLAALCPEGQGTNWVWIQKGCGSERQLSSGSMQQYVMEVCDHGPADHPRPAGSLWGCAQGIKAPTGSGSSKALVLNGSLAVDLCSFV